MAAPADQKMMPTQEPIVQTQPYKDEPSTQKPVGTVGQAQATLDKHRQQTGTEEWNSSIWDCFTGADNLCLKGFFCPCFVYGKTTARTRDPSLTGYNRFNEDCLVYAGANCCCGLGWVLHFLKRQEARERWALKGDTVSDLLLSWCCQCCSLIQLEKEVIAKASTPALEKGYVAPIGMVAAPAP